MATRAKTPYVMTFDDDLMPSDNHLLSDVLSVVEQEEDHHRIVGAFGKILEPSLVYEKCPSAQLGQTCDIVLGRVMVLRTEALSSLNWNVLHQGCREVDTVDDIIVSASLSNGVARRHFLSPVFADRLIELPDNDAICKQEGHFIRREIARRYWYNR